MMSTPCRSSSEEARILLITIQESRMDTESGIDGVSEVYIPDAWSSHLSESLLAVFTEHLNKCAVFLKNHCDSLKNSTDQNPHPGSNVSVIPDNMGNVEVECRFGQVSPETLNFTPGIDQEVFGAMRHHLLHRISSSQRGDRPWLQEQDFGLTDMTMTEIKPHAVHCVETDYLDVLFSDNIRVTFRLYFLDKNLTTLKSIK